MKKRWTNSDRTALAKLMIDNGYDTEDAQFVSCLPSIGAKKVYSIYFVDRCYGGGEEGGWWYNHYDFKRAYSGHSREAVERLARFINFLEGLENNLDRVNSEGVYMVLAEKTPGEHETINAPVYS